ncbi:MAG: glycosyltransferase family 9 protein [Bryobacteraceae bacterium]
MTSPQPASIAAIRLGAMGDILHTLPAVASLKRSFPESRLTWVVASKWAPLLEGNPYVDAVLPFDRRNWKELLPAVRALNHLRPELAVDFQGLIQSAITGRLAIPGTFIGFASQRAREPLAARFYSRTVQPLATHIVDQNLELAAAAGATVKTIDFPIPPGRPEGDLPAGAFVLTNPFAGWTSKQWPFENYATLAAELRRQGLTLVVNVSTDRSAEFAAIPNITVHVSSLAGLIDATRRATAVLGLDSGPLHLAAALGKPGVGLYGPTDPARNGPYGGTICVLRSPDAETTYKRGAEIHSSMRAISVESVVEALRQSIANAAPVSRQ